MTESVRAARPLADDVDESFGIYDAGAGEIAEFEVRGRVFGDLFPEAGLELEKVVVYARTDYFECIVHVCEGEEGFAFEVCGCDVDGVKGWGVVIKDPEEVVIVADCVVWWRQLGKLRSRV